MYYRRYPRRRYPALYKTAVDPVSASILLAKILGAHVGVNVLMHQLRKSKKFQQLSKRYIKKVLERAAEGSTRSWVRQSAELGLISALGGPEISKAIEELTYGVIKGLRPRAARLRQLIERAENVLKEYPADEVVKLRRQLADLKQVLEQVDPAAAATISAGTRLTQLAEDIELPKILKNISPTSEITGWKKHLPTIFHYAFSIPMLGVPGLKDIALYNMGKGVFTFTKPIFERMQRQLISSAIQTAKTRGKPTITQTAMKYVLSYPFGAFQEELIRNYPIIRENLLRMRALYRTWQDVKPTFARYARQNPELKELFEEMVRLERQAREHARKYEWLYKEIIS